MPGGLVLFNRILPLASDDLSIPSFLLLCLHLIGVAFSLTTNSLFSSPLDCYSTPPLFSTKIFIPFHLFVYLVFCILDLVVCYYSLKGTVSNSTPRKPVTPTSYIYLFWLCTFDLSSIIIGSLGLRWFGIENTGGICSPQKSFIYSLMFRITLFYDWTLFILLSGAMSVLFLSSIQNQIEPSDRHRHFKRFISPIFFTSTFGRSFCSGSGSGRMNEHGGPEPQKVLQSVATLLTDLFASANMCASDIVVGLILVRKKYLKDEENDHEEDITDAQFHQNTPIFDTFLISYYSQYAEAMYGIPLLWYSDFSRGTKYMCCPCLNRNQTPVDAIEKTMETGCQAFLCCFPGSWLVDQSTHPDLLYKSIQGKIFKSPFAVAVDRNTHSVIISVRGTLSTTDFLVDLYLDEQQIEWIDADGNHNVGFVHGGMFAIAKAIMKELEDMNIISLLHNDICLQNMNIICAGHSLGAGVCALLAFLLKSSPLAKRVYAICYSAPGFLISASAISYFKTFCTSVVLGDDFVCRINPHNTEDLKNQVYTELQTCNQRKIDIFSYEIIRQIFSHHQPNRRESRESLLSNSNDFQAYPIDSRGYNGQKLYIPGNVFHLRKKDGNSSDVGSPSGNANSAEEFEPRWVDPIKFGRRMILSDKMLIHHFPNRLGDVLRSLS